MSLLDESFSVPRCFVGVDRLWGAGAFAYLQKATVLLIGVGGVGTWCAEALARSGVGRIVLIDMDHVSTSNINRQLIATSATLGMSKIEAMKARIESIHEWTQVELIDAMLDAEHWPSIQKTYLSPSSSCVVIDCCDDSAAKTLMIQDYMRGFAALARSPWIHVVSGAAGGKIYPQEVQVASLDVVTHDPLLKKIRQRLKADTPETAMRASWSSIDCVFSKEMIKKPQSACDYQQHGLHCAGLGSSAMVTATFGMTAAATAINRLIQKSKE